MIDFLINCFHLINLFLILFICFLLYLYNRKSNYKLEKQIEDSIQSIDRRSEECPQQYPNGWLPVYDSHDLKKKEIKHIVAFGCDLVIYRGLSGKVYIFDAYCPHLGANLGTGGIVVGEDIKCHFHGWQFNNIGTHIPDIEAIQKTRIKKWLSDEVNDFIYVWHHSDNEQPDWFMPKLDEIGSFRCHHNTNIKVYCHIQDIFENESDVIHFQTIHGKEKTIPNILKNLVQFKINHKFWKPCDAPDTHCSQTEFNVCLKIGFLDLPPVKNKILHIGPSFFCQQMNFVIIGTKISVSFNVITLNDLKQMIVYKLYTEPTIRGFLLSKLMSKLVIYFSEQDRLTVWNRKTFKSQPIFTKLDETIIKFRRWYRQFYSHK